MDSLSEYEMPFRPDEIDAIRNNLTPIYQSADIHIATDQSGYTFVEQPLWSQDEKTKRLFFLGNGHGDISRFTEVFLSMRNVMKPLNIVNFDFHVDHALHTKNEDLFSSWQRDLYERKYTNRLSSYNVFPNLETVQLSSIVQTMDPEEFLTLPQHAFDIVSIDLDVFEPYQLNMPDIKPLLSAIEQSIKNTKSVMIFTSPMFTSHPEKETICQMLFDEAITHPVAPQ